MGLWANLHVILTQGSVITPILVFLLPKCVLANWFFIKVKKKLNRGRIVSLTNGHHLQIGYPSAKTWKQRKPQPHILYKNYVKTDHRFVCKTQNYKIFRRKNRRKSLTHWTWWKIKSKISKLDCIKNKIFCSVKDSIKVRWEKIFANHKSGRKKNHF